MLPRAFERFHGSPLSRLPVVLHMDRCLFRVFDLELDGGGDVHGDVIPCERLRSFHLIG